MADDRYDCDKDAIVTGLVSELLNSDTTTNTLNSAWIPLKILMLKLDKDFYMGVDFDCYVD